MHEVIEQDSRYPEWLKAWNAKAAEIDQQIIDFFSGRGERTPENTRELGMQLEGWWDRQKLDQPARSQYEKARNEDFICKQVENCACRLEDEGRLSYGGKSRHAATSL